MRTRWKANSGRADWAPCQGLVLTLSEPKAVISSGAVSPAMRLTPSTVAVTRPLRAAGRMIRSVVFHSGAPSARDDSRRPLGTSLITSSAVRATVGSMRTESAMAAASPEKPSWKRTTHIV